MVRSQQLEKIRCVAIKIKTEIAIQRYNIY
jgi:hypothetical protein